MCVCVCLCVYTASGSQLGLCMCVSKVAFGVWGEPLSPCLSEVSLKPVYPNPLWAGFAGSLHDLSLCRIISFPIISTHLLRDHHVIVSYHILSGLVSSHPFASHPIASYHILSSLLDSHISYIICHQFPHLS